jgi:hypothetical protein
MKENTEEEAVLKNEPLDNSYTVIEPNRMGTFPYFLLGIVKCTYEYSNTSDISEGVGIIIGADLVLTSAHNLYNKTSSGTVTFPNIIEFTPLINGEFQIFKIYQCNNFFIPEKFKELKKQENIFNFKIGGNIKF